MDGWMAGWLDGLMEYWMMGGEDLIICVAIWMPNKARGPLTSDDLRVSSIASQNKLRFTSLFGAILDGFGSQNGRKNRCLSLFFSICFSNAFLDRFPLDF